MTSIETTMAIQELHARYGQFVDDRRFEELGSLFCEDAVWEAEPFRYEGRAGIVAGFEEMEPPEPGMVKHLTFSAVIEADGDQAHAWADAIALLVAAPGEPSSIVGVGRYHDVLRREDGRWCFARRLFVYSGQSVPDAVRQTPPSS